MQTFTCEKCGQRQDGEKGAPCEACKHPLGTPWAEPSNKDAAAPPPTPPTGPPSSAGEKPPMAVGGVTAHSNPGDVPPPAPPARHRRAKAGGIVFFASVILVMIVAVIYPLVARSDERELKLRLHSSRMFKPELMRELARQFLADEGATRESIKESVKTEDGGRRVSELSVDGSIPSKGTRLTLEFLFCDSKATFDNLSRRECEVGFSWRKIEPREARARTAVPSVMGSEGGEYVWARDGIAIIVNRGNPITRLSEEHVRKIFTGKIRSWEELALLTGGQIHGPIEIFAPSQDTEIHEGFIKAFFPGGQGDLPEAQGISLDPSAEFRDDCEEVGAEVAQKVNRIGFVNLPSVGAAKRIEVIRSNWSPSALGAAGGAPTYLPSTRPVYLYTSNAAGARDDETARYADRFRAFVTDMEGGQRIIVRKGLVSLAAQAETGAGHDEPLDYKQLTTNAQEVRDFECLFVPGSHAFDRPTLDAVERLAASLKEMLRNNSADVMVFGFADSEGSESMNQRVSERRAQAVAARLRGKGIFPSVIMGFGERIPERRENTDEGKRQNRRVEIWLRP